MRTDTPNPAAATSVANADRSALWSVAKPIANAVETTITQTTDARWPSQVAGLEDVAHMD